MSNILFFIFEGMTDYEITLAMHLLGADAGKNIITIAYDDEVRSKSGVIYKPNMRVKDSLDIIVDGLVLCGGWYGNISEDLSSLIYKINAEGKLLAGICGAGTYILAKLGILDNVNYTTPITEWSEKHKQVFGNENPFKSENFLNSSVVRDKNIITALGQNFIDFSVEICDWFNLFDDDKEKSELLKYLKS